MAFRPRPSSSGLSNLRRRPATVFLRPSQPPPLQARFESRYPYPGGRPQPKSQYNRFSRPQSIKYLWQTSQAFRYGVGAAGTGAVGFIGYNMENVPVSGRRRFNWVSPEYEEQMGQRTYQQIMQEYRGRILPEYHPATRMVQRVLERLIPASGVAGQDWEVNVIDDNSQMNAFVIPG